MSLAKFAETMIGSKDLSATAAFILLPDNSLTVLSGDLSVNIVNP
jgi:hypothetical protein